MGFGICCKPRELFPPLLLNLRLSTFLSVTFTGRIARDLYFSLLNKFQTSSGNRVTCDLHQKKFITLLCLRVKMMLPGMFSWTLRLIFSLRAQTNCSYVFNCFALETTKNNAREFPCRGASIP